MSHTEDITPSSARWSVDAAREGDIVRIDLPRECPLRRGINRWIDDHDLYRFKPRARLGGHDGVSLGQKGRFTVHNLARVFYCLLFATLCASLAIFFNPDTGSWWIPTALGGATLFVLILRGWGALSKTRMGLVGDDLVVEHTILGIPVRTLCSCPLDEIDEINIEEITSGAEQYVGMADTGIRSCLWLKSHDRTVLLGSGLSRRAARWVRDRIVQRRSLVSDGDRPDDLSMDDDSAAMAAK